MTQEQRACATDTGLPIEFAAIHYDRKTFDAQWQTMFGMKIRLAAETCAKTKDELRQAFDTEPEAFADLCESLFSMKDELDGLVKLAQSAAARIMIVGTEAEEAGKGCAQ